MRVRPIEGTDSKGGNHEPEVVSYGEHRTEKGGGGKKKKRERENQDDEDLLIKRETGT